MDDIRIDRPDPIRGQRIAWAVLVVVLTGLGVWTLREFLAAMVWAGILAIAFWPSFQRTRRRWPDRSAHIQPAHPQPASAPSASAPSAPAPSASAPSGPAKPRASHHDILVPALFTIGIALIFVLPLVLAGVQAGREARTVIAWLDSARHEGIPVPDFVSHLPFFQQQARDWWQENLSDPAAASELVSRLNNPKNMAAGQEVGLAILHRVVTFGFCLLTLFFLFKDGESLARQLRHASTRAFGPVGERIGSQIIASIHGTVSGLVLVGLVEGLLLYIVYLFVGVPRPVLLGGITAVGAMIPFGAPLIFGVAALSVFVEGHTAGAVIIIAAGMVITFVADHFVRPVLIGSSTRLPFIWVLFGILGGVATWGLLGLFLGPAIMAVLMLLWREWTETA